MRDLKREKKENGQILIRLVAVIFQMHSFFPDELKKKRNDKQSTRQMNASCLLALTKLRFSLNAAMNVHDAKPLFY